MLSISKTTGYAIQALSAIARARPKLCYIRDIAEKTGVRRPYLFKIINHLAHDGLVTAKRGHQGGVALARPPEQIWLSEVVKSIEGDAWMASCLFGLESCMLLGRCPVHAQWKAMRVQVEGLLRATTLADVMKALPRHRGEMASATGPLPVPCHDQGCAREFSSAALSKAARSGPWRAFHPFG